MATDKRMSMEQIIIPFESGKVKKFTKHLNTSSHWQKNAAPTEPDLLYRHALSDLNSAARFSHQNLPTYDRITFLAGETRKTFTYCGAELYLFSTGLGFFIINYSYPLTENESAPDGKEIAVFHGQVKNLFTQNSSLELSAGETEKISLKQFIESSLELANSAYGITLFPNNRRKRPFVFSSFQNMSLIQDKQKTEIAGVTEGSAPLKKGGIPGTFCYISQYNLHVYCNASTENGEDSFYADTCNSLSTVFLIAISKHQSLLGIYRKMKNLEYHPRKAGAMKKEMLSYMGTKQYPIVTDDEYFQKIYEELEVILQLDEMEKNLSTLLFTLDEEASKKNASAMNTFLVIFGSLSLFDTIAMGLSLDQMLNSENPPVLGIVTSIVLVVTGIAALAFAGKKLLLFLSRKLHK